MVRKSVEGLAGTDGDRLNVVESEEEDMGCKY